MYKYNENLLSKKLGQRLPPHRNDVKGINNHNLRNHHNSLNLLLENDMYPHHL